MRSAPPPDFRYVGLEPTPSAKRVLAIAGGIGALTSAVALLFIGTEIIGFAVATALGVTIFLLLVSRRITLLMRAPVRQYRMAIVPWGVLVYSDQVRVLRWSTVRTVNVSSVHEMDQATPLTRFSMVTVSTEREVFGGYAAGGVSLELLEVHLHAYAEECSRALALDLAGRRALNVPLEPACEQLIDQARWLIRAGRISDELSLAPVGYRAGREVLVPEGVVQALRHAFERSSDNPDPRALAAILAAELQLESLKDHILSLTTSPHPVLAGVARAAALRLGCDLPRVGALDELVDFLPGPDLEALHAWVKERPDLRSGSRSARLSSNAA